MTQDKPPSPPITTFANPEGLVVLVAAGVTAAVASMPIIVVPGVLAYGILTWLRYNRWTDQQKDAAFQPVTVELSRLPSPSSRRVATCVNLQARVIHEIATADPTHRSMLSASVDRVRALALSSFDLALKLQQIEEHLVGEDRRSLQSEGASLKKRMESAEDPLARDRYERAYDQHLQKVRIYEELRARRERIDAQLTNIQLTLETVSAQVLRIKSAEAGTASNESARVIESLDALSIDVQALAETVEETVEASGSLEANRLHK